MCSNLLEGGYCHHLCENTSRCPPAVINKCTSIAPPNNSASCNKNQVYHEGPGATAPGTGIFFNHAICSQADTPPEFSIRRLAHLANVACDSTDMQSGPPASRSLSAILKPGKDLKKRRTPRLNGQFHALEPLHSSQLRLSSSRSWSTLKLRYNTTHFQPNQLSNESSLSQTVAGESEVRCSSGGLSGSSLTGTSQNGSFATSDTGKTTVSKKARKKPETRVERYAKTILVFVGKGRVPEKLIRLTLGNNPDTSKALRLLLAHRKLKRLGEGGKGSAYLYMATPTGLKELEQMTPEEQALFVLPKAQMPLNEQASSATSPQRVSSSLIGASEIIQMQISEGNPDARLD